MKKTLLLALTIASSAFCFSGCTDEPGNVSSAHIDTDSSYYGVNFTDTGDPDSNLGNSSVNVEYSSIVSTKSEASGKDKASAIVSSDARMASSKKNENTSSGTTTKTTVTYYYTDENGEHSTDTEIYISTDTDLAAFSSSIIASSEASVETDSTTDTESDSDSELTSAPNVTTGSFEESDLVFEYNGASIYYGADIESIVSILGEPLHIDSFPNSENHGLEDKTYNYDFFSIDTKPSPEDESVYIVSAFQIFDDQLQTEKGVRIGMPALDAVRKYGTDYMICDDEYRYYIGGRYLYLYVQNSIVANIGLGYDAEVSPE